MKGSPEPDLQVKDLPAVFEHRFPTGFDDLSGTNLECGEVTADG